MIKPCDPHLDPVTGCICRGGVERLC